MPQCHNIEHTKQQAFYGYVKDYINMPKQSTLPLPESYYCTLFHELVHAIGHASRLASKEIVQFDTFALNQYRIKELTAEIGVSYLNSTRSPLGSTSGAGQLVSMEKTKLPAKTGSRIKHKYIL